MCRENLLGKIQNQNHLRRDNRREKEKILTTSGNIIAIMKKVRNLKRKNPNKIKRRDLSFTKIRPQLAVRLEKSV